MPATITLLPARRSELVVRPLGDDGQCVVKDPSTGAYFQLGPQEHFLVTRLDGLQDADSVRTEFERQFGQPLSDDELIEFVEAIREQGLLETPSAKLEARNEGPAASASATKQSILCWRKNVFDPDRLFNSLEPRIRFFWTRGFLVFSAACIVLAGGVVWVEREQITSSFLSALHWETAVWAWLTLFVVTLLHEFAHGLTCKHYGGEVHEVGFLCLYFMPCFYCNVSDAWLFKEKSKRLWVTFAGGYFELFLWALAVFVWRLTLPGTFINYLAFIVVAAAGVQTLLNFNPLLKLDGYYLLSDWKEIPNLQERAGEFSKAHLRRLLWGAPRPEPEPRGQFFLYYGVASLLFSLGFLVVSLLVIANIASAHLGWFGWTAVGFLGFFSLRGLLKGLVAGEVSRMILMRRRRTVMWLMVLGSVGSALALIDMRDRSSGPFQLRAAARADIRAPVAGFIREVQLDEGERVSPGMPLLRLEVPDLAVRLAQRRADIRQAEARLQQLSEELAEQQRRVERGGRWRDQAKEDLERAGRVLAEELARLDRQVDQARAEVEAGQTNLVRTRSAAARGAVAAEQVSEAERRQRSGAAQLAQSQAERRAREARGVAEGKLELDRRERELIEAAAALHSLQSGTRAKEIEAEEARLASLREEERYLRGVEAKLTVYSPVPGIVTTPRLKEKVGQYVKEGELICVIEEPEGLEAEITLHEQDVGCVRVGQSVGLKARALPHETFTACVDRVAPAAVKGEGQNTVTVYCRLEGMALRPGMTGHARVYTGERSVGGFLIDRLVRYLRTEFWW
ncbi:MAG TPA: HlyD family efflux transporter periplasmic adaptor subunit [Gemmataceae bacterium]|nr:HlyD family efflux transporter periplasmic adaptor subunit [Gemmataceae bacterium]